MRKSVLRSVRLDDDVWDAIKAMDVSLNQYLREAFFDATGSRYRAVPAAQPSVIIPRSDLDAVGPKLSDGMGKATTQTFKGPLLKPNAAKASEKKK